MLSLTFEKKTSKAVKNQVEIDTIITVIIIVIIIIIIVFIIIITYLFNFVNKNRN